MPLPDSLHNAARTLTSALDLLEAAIERRVQVEALRDDRAEEFALMQEDRASLGEALEAVSHDKARLVRATDELAGRLVRMERLCAALRQRTGG